MNPRKYAQVRESVAADKVPEAIGAAMVPQVYMMPTDTKVAAAKKLAGGMDLTGEEAAARAGKVSLGKKSMLFRFGNRHEELAGAVEELVKIMRAAKDKNGKDRVDLTVTMCGFVATAALHELAFDRCGTCMGRGVVQDHSIKDLEGKQPMRECQTCFGQKRRRTNEDERIGLVARVMRPEDPGAAAKALRAKPSNDLRALLNAVDFAKGLLLESERIAVESAGLMIERWGAEDVR